MEMNMMYTRANNNNGHEYYWERSYNIFSEQITK